VVKIISKALFDYKQCKICAATVFIIFYSRLIWAKIINLAARTARRGTGVPTPADACAAARLPGVLALARFSRRGLGGGASSGACRCQRVVHLQHKFFLRPACSRVNSMSPYVIGRNAKSHALGAFISLMICTQNFIKKMCAASKYAPSWDTYKITFLLKTKSKIDNLILSRSGALCYSAI
jgi:hypothetical protein